MDKAFMIGCIQGIHFQIEIEVWSTRNIYIYIYIYKFDNSDVSD